MTRSGGAAKLAEVEQRDQIEVRQRRCLQVVDVGEQHLVVLSQNRIADDQLYVALDLIGRDGHAQNHVTQVVNAIAQSDDVMAAGAEVKDGLRTDVTLLQKV